LNFHIKHIIAFIFVLLIGASLSANVVVEAMITMPFKKSNGLILIDAEVNGHKGSFIFDTGANSILVNSRYFSNASNNKIEQMAFYTFNGQVMGEALDIKSLTLGSLNLTDVEAYRSDLLKLEEITKHKLLGIIGAHLFEADVMHIDNLNNKIEFSPRESINAIANGRFLRSKIIVDNGFTLLPLEIENQYYNFCIDTGSSISVIDSEVLKKHVHLLSSSKAAIKVQDADHQSSNTVYSIDQVQISKLSINELSVAQKDLSDISFAFDNKVHGILSLDQLPIDNIIIDFKSEAIYFSY